MLAFVEVPNVQEALLVSTLTKAMFFVAFKFPFVFVAIVQIKKSNAVFLVIFPVSFVDIAPLVKENAIAMPYKFKIVVSNHLTPVTLHVRKNVHVTVLNLKYIIEFVFNITSRFDELNLKLDPVRNCLVLLLDVNHVSFALLPLEGVDWE